MSETALYRKYRPRDWKSVLGQEHVTDILEGSIKLEKVSHAYIFAGSRGTGKTSVARIFAKSLGSSDNDIYEIDAASNRGIDDIRAIRESVNSLPFNSKYKIYIVDEVHMLTKDAWNAFLKTLEEPPAHAIFIMATTEMDKIPETVVSRCQIFSFKKPSQEILKNLIISIAKKEGFALEPSSAELIAILSEGSFRDAEGILQKVISASSDKKISPEEVLRATGAPRSELVNDFISAIEAGDASDGLLAIEEAKKINVDISVYLKLILQKIRMILLLRYAPDMEKKIKDDLSETDFAFLKEIARKKESKINSSVLVALLEADAEISRAYLPELPLELAVIKLTSSS